MAANGHSSRPGLFLDRLTRESAGLALFLDFDGTLTEVAPTPDSAVAPAGLSDLLKRLSARLGGALAVISGREIADLDMRLAPFRGAAAGVHGAEIRLAPESDADLCAAELDPSSLAEIRRLAAFEPRLLIEDKGASIAVHYRAAESAAPRLEAALERYIAAGAGGLRLLRGRKVFEVLSFGFSKAQAVTRFMETTPFAGRRPVMIGDDLADLAAFDACVARGGQGFRVAGELFPASEADFSGPEAVRAWLADLAAQLSYRQEPGK